MIRFWEKVSPEPNTGCWLWMAHVTRYGYGQFGIKSTQVVPAHRFAYEQIKGQIPEGLTLDHLCRVRCCVNPDHLEPVTNAENIRRGIAGKLGGERMSSKTHCPAGHAYDEANTYRHSDGKKRQCRKCKADAVRRWRERQVTLI